MPLRKHLLFWLPCPLLRSSTVYSPLRPARHPASGPWLKRAWTDGGVEGGSWKHTKSVEKPKTKTGKLKIQPTVGQKDKEHASCQGNLEKGTEGQPSSPTLLTYKSMCFSETCLFSFEFERITETREFYHLLLQIMRLVIISLVQGCLPERLRRSWHPVHTLSPGREP